MQAGLKWIFFPHIHSGAEFYFLLSEKILQLIKKIINFFSKSAQELPYCTQEYGRLKMRI
jgi:hypothetical protein